MKNKILFYILSWTWGLPMTFIGVIVAFVLVIMKYKPKYHGGCVYFNMGKYWGGINLGMFFVTDTSDDVYTRNHEWGHAVQNCFFGPLMPFVITIPSCIRYWYREIRSKMGLENKTSYYSIWFEKQASEWGEKTIEVWNNTIK